MHKVVQKVFGILALVLLGALAASSVSAYHYNTYTYRGGDAYHYGYGYPDAYYAPIYPSAYYTYPNTYGYGGWNYNRVYYNYHYPYAMPNGWTRAYYPMYPAYIAYPVAGYYW